MAETNTPYLSAVDEAPQNRLHRLLQIRVATGLVMTGLVIGFLFSVFIYHAQSQRLKSELAFQVDLQAAALDREISRLQHIAAQITSRTRVREELERFNRGEIDREALLAFSAPILTDAMQRTADVMGISRLDVDGTPLLQVGESIPPAAWPRDALEDQIRLGTPLRVEGKLRLVVSAPIRNRQDVKVGIDLVAFDVARLQDVMQGFFQRYQGRGNVRIAAVSAEQISHLLVSGDLHALPEAEFLASRARTALTDDGATLTLAGSENGQRLIAHARVGDSTWVFLLSTDADDFLAPARRQAFYVALSVLTLTLLGGALTLFFIRPLAGRISVETHTLRQLAQEREDFLKKVQASESRLQGILDNTPSVIHVKDLKGRYLLVNRRFEVLFRVARKSVVGRTDRELFPEHIANALRTDDGQVLERNSPMEREHKIPHDDGAHDYLIARFPLRDAAGAVEGICSVCTDVTERKRSEAVLRESESFHRQTLESIPGMVFTTRPDGYCDYQSQQWVDYTGIPMSEHLGDGWNRLLHPEDQPRAFAAWRDAVAAVSPYDLEYRVRRHDGVYEWFRVIGCPIRDSRGQIVRWLGVAMNIENLKRAEQALRDADRRKDEFLATLAHELRNPLAPIRNAVEMLGLRDLPQAAEQSARAMIERQVKHMVHLIDDLLDVSRITRGKLHLRKERVDLSVVLERTLEAHRPLAESMGHELSLEAPPDPMPLHADPVRLEQVFTNLLNNACKYTAPGGRIRLSGERIGTEVAIRVEDTGIGIAAEHLPHLFEMFAQLPSHCEQSQTGLGIGLSLARGLVEMHGGRIEAASAGVGKGSTFTVRLPLAAATGRGTGADRQGTEQRETAPCRILVVDDLKDVAESLALLLRAHGHEVEAAHDGLAAIARAERFRPDVVLLDIGMPRLDGYGACRRMRAQPWGRKLKIIALTGWGQDADRRKSAEAGFDGHLVKPVAPQAIFALLDEIQSEES